MKSLSPLWGSAVLAWLCFTQHQRRQTRHGGRGLLPNWFTHKAGRFAPVVGRVLCWGYALGVFILLHDLQALLRLPHHMVTGFPEWTSLENQTQCMAF